MQVLSTTNVNLVPNPNLVVNITDGWSPDADYTRDTSSGGPWVKQVSTTGFANFTTVNDGVGIVVTPNTTYTISFYYKLAITSGFAPHVQINVGSAFGTSLSDNSLTAQASPTRYTVTVTTGASDTHLFIRIYNNGGSVTGYYRSFMIEPNATASTYFDGSSGTGYYWSGTANFSTSFYRQFEVAAASNIRAVTGGVQIAWSNTPNVSTGFFTINTSKIGGADIIKGAGSAVTFFDKYQYTNESARLISFNITRQLAQRPYGVIMAQAEVVLDNYDDRYTPGADPTIGASILPGRPIKLSIGLNRESIQQFVGYIDVPRSPVTSKQTTITAYDAMTYLEGVKSQLQSITNTSADQIIAAVLTEAGFASSQYALDQSLQQPISYYNPQGQKATDIFKELCEAECALMFVDESGIIRFWNRQHFNSNRTTRFALNYSNVEDVDWDSTPIINSASVVSKPLKVMGKTLLWTNGQSIQLLPGQSTDVFADFQDDNGSFPATSVDVPLPVASSTSSEYTSNLNADGSGADGNGFISITSTYLFGARYRMTFTNTSGMNVYLTKLEVYGVPAKVQVIDPQLFDDPTSITNYTINPNNNGDVVEIDNNAIQDSSTALALAYILVKQYGTPMSRLICPSAFPQPQLQIGDYGSVTAGALVHSGFLVGIATKLDNNGLAATYDVEERPTYNYFTIASSSIGGADTIAP